jgi:hypothetical protein
VELSIGIFKLLKFIIHCYRGGKMDEFYDLNKVILEKSLSAITGLDEITAGKGSTFYFTLPYNS